MNLAIHLLRQQSYSVPSCKFIPTAFWVYKLNAFWTLGGSIWLVFLHIPWRLKWRQSAPHILSFGATWEVSGQLQCMIPWEYDLQAMVLKRIFQCPCYRLNPWQWACMLHDNSFIKSYFILIWSYIYRSGNYFKIFLRNPKICFQLLPLSLPYILQSKWIRLL